MTGIELRAFRKRLGLTQALFAQTLGISVSQLINYERGYDRHPPQRACVIPRLVELACMAPAQELLAFAPDRGANAHRSRSKVRSRHL
jgi:transcriptional regulator with XRE-family HTH domain